jgi:hypothetical protein
VEQSSCRALASCAMALPHLAPTLPTCTPHPFPAQKEQKEQIAQEKFGKGYQELSSNEQKSVGGTL